MKRALACLLTALVFFCGEPGAADTGDLESAGDAVRLALPVAAAGAALAHRDREGGTQLVVSLAAAVAATEGLKLFVKERRPNGTGDDAFPSGHASVAFSGAAFLHRRYGWTYGAPAYLFASFVGYTRIRSDEHRLHDVLAGAAIGILANVIFTTPYGAVAVAPVTGGGFLGIVVSAGF